MSKMELKEFSDLLEMHGALLADWPDDDLARVGDLLEKSEVARRLLQDTVALEEELDHFRAPEPSAALRETVLAEAAEVLEGYRAKAANHRPFGKVLQAWFLQLTQPIATPAIATWLLVAALGVASGVALTGQPVSEDQVLAYYGGDSALWVDALALDKELQNGSGS